MARHGGAVLWLALLMVVSLAYQGSAEQTGPGLGKDNKTIAEIFMEDHFNAFFPHRDDPLGHAVGFYDYRAFMTAASMFEKQGFGLRGGADVQKRELAAFFAHVAHETTCGWSGAKDGPYAWGLCYNQELSPPTLYCKQDFDYPCVNGVSYHCRGVFPVCYNYNYGTVGNALGVDLLHYPDNVSNNATLAFATALWKWMVPQKPNPSPHDVMVGAWKPAKGDLDNSRFPGFGMTTNILAGQIECGHGDDPRGQDRVSHYSFFARDILGLDDLGDDLDCGLQKMLPTGFTAVK